MKIVVIGGTGLIGSKTVPILRQAVMRSSPRRPKAVSSASFFSGSNIVVLVLSFLSFSLVRPYFNTMLVWNLLNPPSSTYFRRR